MFFSVSINVPRVNGNAVTIMAAVRCSTMPNKKVKALGLLDSGRVRVQKAGCFDRCEQGPLLVVYPEAVWYTFVDEEDIDEILTEHLQHGRIVERLRVADHA